MARQRISYEERIARYQVKHGVSHEVARKAAQGGHGKVKSTPVAGVEIVQTKSGQAALRTLKQAARDGKRVSVTVKTKDGQQRQMFENKGRKASPNKPAVKRGAKGAGARWVLDKKIGKGNAKSATAFKGWVAGAASQVGIDAESSDEVPDADTLDDEEYEHDIEPDDIDEIQINVYDD